MFVKGSSRCHGYKKHVFIYLVLQPYSLTLSTKQGITHFAFIFATFLNIRIISRLVQFSWSLVNYWTNMFSAHTRFQGNGHSFFQFAQIHYTDVIMTTMAFQITSLTAVHSIVYSDADQRKHQRSALLAFVWGIHRDRWIPRTKGQLRGKCFHLMTSSWNCSQLYLQKVWLLCGWWHYRCIPSGGDISWTSQTIAQSNIYRKPEISKQLYSKSFIHI